MYTILSIISIFLALILIFSSLTLDRNKERNLKKVPKRKSSSRKIHHKENDDDEVEKVDKELKTYETITKPFIENDK